MTITEDYCDTKIFIEDSVREIYEIECVVCCNTDTTFGMGWDSAVYHFYKMGYRYMKSSIGDGMVCPGCIANMKEAQYE